MTTTDRPTPEFGVAAHPAVQRRAGASSRPASAGHLATVAAVAGSFLAMLDTTVVNVSLHATSQQFGDIAAVQWVLTTYMLALCATMTASAWLVERVGPKRAYAAALTVFGLASLACGLAPSLAFLVGARAVAGAAAGVITPVSTVLLTRGVPRERLGVVQSLQGSVMMIGPLVGPTVGGLLVAGGGWPAVYLVNVPVCALLLILTLRLAADEPGGARRRLDVPGLVSGTLAIVGGIAVVSLIGSVPWTSPVLWGGALVALAAGWVFVRRELSTDQPLLDLTLFRQPIYAWSSLNVFFLGFSLYAPMIIIPLYLQAARNNGPVSTGLLLSIGGLGVIAAGLVCPALLRRYRAGRVMVGGLLLTVAGSLPFVWLSDDTPYALICAALMIRGAGVSLAVFPAMTRAYQAIPAAAIADAAPQLNLLTRMGGTLAAALIIMVLRQGAAAEHGLTSAVFATASVWSLVATAVTLVPALLLLVAEGNQRREPGHVG